ncbi:MAG TPA: Cro/CI family transcriptional regulator [Burkholderiales bacterium]|nr:Cro/CI family transcriptional regulator [Burkholderiales bacterium]
MRYEEVVAHFGGVTKTAQALETKKQVVHHWSDHARIPSKWQLKIQRRTRGRLKADKRSRDDARIFLSAIA